MPVKVKSITVNKDMCKQCGICVSFCPKQVLVSDEAGNVEVANLEACSGCMICELLCPDLAISVDMPE